MSEPTMAADERHLDRPLNSASEGANFTPKLIVIVGPTASGKSALAIELARSLNSVILGADSRQIYRNFDIGTAKPSLSDRAVVAHELIDICDPVEVFTVAEFQSQANQLINHYHQRQIIPLLVGGTGLYIKSVVRGLRIPQVPPQPTLRSQLEQLTRLDRRQLLLAVDPVSAQQIHERDDVRTIRALEVFYATGQPISSLQGEAPPAYPILQIGLDCLGAKSLNGLISSLRSTTNSNDSKMSIEQLDRSQIHSQNSSRKRPKNHRKEKSAPDENDRLWQRIQQRTHSMFEQGFVDEVHQLVKLYGQDLPLFQTLGYREVLQAMNGEITWIEAEQLTAVHTRQFAKRQRTWFRADPNIYWLDADHPRLLEMAMGLVQNFLSDSKEIDQNS
jgi:tRNA dimethylallyltransferase